MMFCYTNSGLSWRAVDADYQPSDGEVIFADHPTDDQLVAAFPSYNTMRERADRAASAATILAEIAAIDLKRVRPAAEIAEALAAGHAPDPRDVARLVDLNVQVADLRTRLLP